MINKIEAVFGAFVAGVCLTDGLWGLINHHNISTFVFNLVLALINITLSIVSIWALKSK